MDMMGQDVRGSGMDSDPQHIYVLGADKKWVRTRLHSRPPNKVRFVIDHHTSCMSPPPDQPVEWFWPESWYGRTVKLARIEWEEVGWQHWVVLAGGTRVEMVRRQPVLPVLTPVESTFLERQLEAIRPPAPVPPELPLPPAAPEAPRVINAAYVNGHWEISNAGVVAVPGWANVRFVSEPAVSVVPVSTTWARVTTGTGNER